ncbi:hypothetical protein GQ457_18G005410 [Hibiscus cannabinus]
MVSGLINANPIVYEKKERQFTSNFVVQVILIFLIFLNHIRDIKDPEHPYSLEELKVITEDAIEVDNERSYVRVTFTPTVEHCSMATVIGLCLRVKLMRSLPSHYKMDIRVAPGTHATEAAVNKQLNDKERVAAALENPNLLDMVLDSFSSFQGEKLAIDDNRAYLEDTLFCVNLPVTSIAALIPIILLCYISEDEISIRDETDTMVGGFDPKHKLLGLVCIPCKSRTLKNLQNSLMIANHLTFSFASFNNSLIC